MKLIIAWAILIVSAYVIVALGSFGIWWLATDLGLVW